MGSLFVRSQKDNQPQQHVWLETEGKLNFSGRAGSFKDNYLGDGTKSTFNYVAQRVGHPNRNKQIHGYLRRNPICGVYFHVYVVPHHESFPILILYD